jgi:hypothetical protein
LIRHLSLGLWNPVKHQIPQIWYAINQKPDFDQAERGKTEPDQTTTKMGIISGAIFIKIERERETERERGRKNRRE